jgi:lactaldehyde dehydrogenase/glycolaldehyde dehydrogenase
MLIDDQLVESCGENWIECINPANKDSVGKVLRGSGADVDRAARAAEVAHVAWRSCPLQILP